MLRKVVIPGVGLFAVAIIVSGLLFKQRSHSQLPEKIHHRIEFSDALVYFSKGGRYLQSTEGQPNWDAAFVVPLIQNLNRCSETAVEVGVYPGLGPKPRSLFLRSPSKDVCDQAVKVCQKMVVGFDGDVLWRITDEGWLQLDVLSPSVASQIYTDSSL